MAKTGESYQAAFQALDQRSPTDPFQNLPTILEFLEPHVTPYPAQRVILKLVYGLPLDDTETFEVRIDPEFRPGEVITHTCLHTEKSYVQHLYEDGRCNVRESTSPHQAFFLALGRRAGKNLIQSWILAYETYRLLQLKDPHASLELQPHQSISLTTISSNNDNAELLRDETRWWLNQTNLPHPHILTKHIARFQTQTDQIHNPDQASVLVHHENSRSSGLNDHFLVLLDNFAHFPFPHDTLKTLQTTVLQPHSKLGVISIPNGAKNAFGVSFASLLQHPDQGLALQIPSWELNPTLNLEKIARELTWEELHQEFGASFIHTIPEEPDPTQKLLQQTLSKLHDRLSPFLDALETTKPSDQELLQEALSNLTQNCQWCDSHPTTTLVVVSDSDHNQSPMRLCDTCVPTLVKTKQDAGYDVRTEELPAAHTVRKLQARLNP